MIKAIFSLLPFMVCSMWSVMFIIGCRKSDTAKRILTLFGIFCSALYLCHAHFFLVGESRAVELIWAFFSLSVYPIYYLYLETLTSVRVTLPRTLLLFTPGVVTMLLIILFPGEVTEMVRKVVYAVQIILVCLFGYRNLLHFDRKIENTYSNTEDRVTKTMQWLLLFIVITSICSATISSLGRNYFAESTLLLSIPSSLFSILLFSIFYIGYTRKNEKDNPIHDIFVEETVPEADEEKESEIAKAIETLMSEKKIYLHKDLKITDIAKEIGICRTYVSNCINNTGLSFSDYINSMRVDYAKKLMNGNPDIKMFMVADESGFSSEQSFYRNFKKFTGTTPQKWMLSQTASESTHK